MRNSFLSDRLSAEEAQVLSPAFERIRPIIRAFRIAWAYLSGNTHILDSVNQLYLALMVTLDGTVTGLLLSK